MTPPPQKPEFHTMKLTGYRFAPGAIHPQA
jgi:hypothetical protein